MEVGIDIEKNERFQNADEHFLRRVFTDSELQYAFKFKNSNEHLCAFWCAKEAFIKATGVKTISLKDIEITHDLSGKPQVSVPAIISNTLQKLGVSEIKISLSHCKDYSTAICVIN